MLGVSRKRLTSRWNGIILYDGMYVKFVIQRVLVLYEHQRKKS